MDAGSEWAELQGAYVAYLEREGRSQETIYGYVKRVRQFVGWCMSHDLSMVTAERRDIARYIRDQRAAGMAKNTLVNDGVALRWLYRFLMDQGQRTDDPTKGVEFVLRSPRQRSLPNLPWRDSFRLYSQMQGRSKVTTRSNIFAAAFYNRWCQGEGIDPITATHDGCARFISRELDRITQLSVIRKLSHLRFFYQYLIDTGQRDDNPADGIRLKMPKLQPQEPFSAEQLTAILAATREPRDRAMVLTLVQSGCRLGELLSMTVERIDWARSLMLVEGKGQRRRYLSLGRVAKQAIILYVGERTGPVWLRLDSAAPLSVHGVCNMMMSLSRRTGIHVHAHRFRTTFACQFIEETGGDVQSAQMLLGHAKIETTLHYAQWPAAQRALAQQRRLSLADRL